MASYNPIILPAPAGFFGGLSAGVSPGLNAYSSAMMKKKFGDMETENKSKKQQEMLDKFTSWAKSNGKDLKYKYSPSGLSAETIEEKDPTMADLQLGAAGALPSNKYAQIGKNMNIQPAILSPEETPGAAMSLASGGVGDVAGNAIAPVQENYGKTVARALQKNPMVTKSRGTQALPGDFANDFKMAHDTAEGDPDKFVGNLKDLALKYSDNPAAINQIKRLVSLNKSKSAKSSSVSRLR